MACILPIKRKRASDLKYPVSRLTTKEDEMKRLMKKLEDIVVAVTFAEAGEYETAMEVLGQKSGEEEVVTEPITDPEIV